MESIGISFCVTPFYFLTKNLMAPNLSPCAKPPWHFGKVLTRNPSGAPEPCLLNALNVTKFDVSNLGGRSSLLFDIDWFLGQSQKDNMKTQKKSQQKSVVEAGLES